MLGNFSLISELICIPQSVSHLVLKLLQKCIYREFSSYEKGGQ